MTTDALAGSPQAETRTFARELLRQTSFTPADAEALIARLVALLRSFTAGEAELSNIQRAQQGLESTRYVNRAVKRLLYLLDERRDAFDEFFRVVHAGLEAFRIQDERMRQRLKPSKN